MLKVNREILKHKGILDVIENCENGSGVRVENGKLYYKETLLDEDIPLKEDKIASTDTIFLHGFGMGNALRKLNKKFPKTVIVVFETEPCIMKKALSEIDFSKILDERVIPVILKGDFEEEIRVLISLLERRIYWGEVIQFTTPGYDRVSFYDINKIKSLINKYLIPIFVNRNTILNKSKKIFSNMVENTPSIVKGGDTEHFHNAFKGKPAIVVASGPSLSKNIDFLKEVVNKAVIIAADSVLSVLYEKNIKPDFVCGVDYQEINQMKYTPILKEKKRSNITYVAVDGVNSLIPKLFERSFFEYSSSGFVYLYREFFEERKKKRFSLNAVTHLAIQLAYIMGCNPIIFVGQDWAFTGGMDHAKGVMLDGSTLNNAFWVKGNYQDKVPTDQTLYSGLKIVEDIIRATKNEGVEYINATEGGAYIEGTTVMSLRDAAMKYLPIDIEKGFLNVEVRPKYGEFIGRTKQISKRLEEIVRMASKALAMGNRVLKKWMRNKSVDEIRADVDEMNKINDEITFDEIFALSAQNFFFRDFYYFHREEIDIEGQDTKKRIEQSIKYFTLIRDKSKETKKYIDRLLDFLVLERRFVDEKSKFFKDKKSVLELAELYYKFKDLYGGIDFIDEALKIYPEDASLYYWKAKYCTLNRFMHKEALENFEEALRISPDFKKAQFDYGVEKNMVESHMILAKNAVDKSDYILAKRLIDRALDYEPESSSLKKWKETIEELAKVEKNVHRQNILLKELELESEAFKKYQTALDYVKKEQMGKAFELLKELYDKYGNFADIPFLLGSIYIDKKELDKAEKYLKEAVELIPYQPLVYLALGKLYIEKEDYVAAKENLERAISMSPDLKPGVLDTLGNLYYEFGEYEKAFKAFEEYLQYSDDRIKTLTKLALCYKEMGMINEYNMLMEKIKSITAAN